MTIFLYLDIGNSFIKWCSNDSIIHQKPSSKETIKEILDNCFDHTFIYISNVSSTAYNEFIIMYCQKKNLKPIFPKVVSPSGKLICAYENLNTFGIDRWLGLRYSLSLTKNSFALIDAGTAITIDIVDDLGVHLGGQIIPGIYSLNNALGHTGNQLLADFQSTIPPLDQFGNTTKNCLNFGLYHLLNAYIERTFKLFQDLSISTVFISGGDAKLILSLLPDQLTTQFIIRHLENCVLKGLKIFAQNNN